MRVTPLALPSALLARAGRVADTWQAHTGVAVDVAELLAGRANLLGLVPRERISAGGATRLLPCRDGWVALTLSRRDDVEMIPALVQTDAVADDPWPALQRWVARRHAADVVDRARLLDLPVAALGETPPESPRVHPFGPAAAGRSPAGLLVVDLSAMWAGPLCAQLLARAGATVVKVESMARPDGARSGPPVFFDWINARKLSYAADFGAPGQLRKLLTAADIVIESSRPAALIRRGLGPADIAPRDGRVWVRITGHGASGERATWVAFGDDAAVSGGLARDGDGPKFCGDAIADPLTGLHAAVEAAASLRRGGGELIEMSLSAVAATYADAAAGPETPCAATPWTGSHASPLGADNEAVDALIAERSLSSC